MSAFGGLILTNKGRNLQAKAQLGTSLHFTRIALGDNDLGGTSILDLNSLKHEVKSLPIVKLKLLSGGKAVVGAVFSNQDMASGFYWREIGIFADDPENGEILYCYGNAGANAEYIPAGGGADIIEKAIDVTAIVGNAQNVTASIDRSLIFASQKDIENKVDKVPGKQLSTEDYTTQEKQKLASLSNYSHPLEHPATMIKMGDGSSVEEKVMTHLADYVHQIGYATATGIANTYSITLDPAPTSLVDGLCVAVKINAQNTGASTINVNGLGAKSIKKANGNDVASGNLKAGSIYTLRYNGINFILQGEGGEYGDAIANDIRKGKTIGTEQGIVQGTLEVDAVSIFKANAINDGFSKITPPSTASSIFAVTPSNMSLSVGSSHWTDDLCRVESNLSYDLTDRNFIIFTLSLPYTGVIRSCDSISFGAGWVIESFSITPTYNKIVVDVSYLSGFYKIFLEVKRVNDGSEVQRGVSLAVSDITFK